MTLHPEKSEIKGFTLIELLVVIAIIALLMAVLFPALNTAKLCAKQVICAAQMKQWSLATLAYAAENNTEIPPYADTCDWTNGGNALNEETYWYNRLSPYLAREYHGKWGMYHGNRRCPMGKANWGEKAVWIGVYYSNHEPERAPFIFMNGLNGTTLTEYCYPYKINSIRMPTTYLMMLDTQRDRVAEPIHWDWDTDYDGDGMNDSDSGHLSSSMKTPYNAAQPKIHRGGCNVALFDGHTEWISYEAFWQLAEDGYPAHKYWYNNNRP